MLCPNCGGKTRVSSTRVDSDGVYRYRECLECPYRFYTTEIESDGDDYRRNDNLRRRLKHADNSGGE